MNQTEIKSIAENILNKSFVGPMATVKGNKPHSRYMTFMNDNLTLYTATSRETDKKDEIEANPYTHILLGYDGEGFNDDFVEYTGKVSIHDDESMKEKMWNEHMKHWFDGPEDPDLIVLKITPVAVRVMNKKNLPPKEVEL
ncbi:General stress protein [Lentibacillus sp. JNUCC-1]|uniref:pyridoxamine 5'-phosphate oxidase family protein n=1 Tax=Lentibacillus sp. JNUCC-1 TaxID=2654513 RepID=UPI0012E7B325|nr:pyridoxamine 5'-phosphate oxidase family protein [Lentibacillus sp. JNUCC-1]MUV37626.1 General stress protein [Lentibacillus sp. JNUCC-1]